MIIIHYGEIGLKGKNRRIFEETLIKNIKEAIGNEIRNIYREYGRIIIEEKKNANYKKIKERLSFMPGIENFSFAFPANLDIEDIKKKALEIAKKEKFNSFKIVAKRGNKKFPYTSMKINEIVGREIKEKMNKKVDLENPEMEIFIEIGNNKAYLYKEKLNGVGGLPVGSQGKVISLLSGGIDSPVASFLIMKRGCKVVFIHFYNENLVDEPKKVEEIIKRLTNIQLKSDAYFIPFSDAQSEIIKYTPSKYRMLVYRRVMTMIANRIAEKEKAKAIVTGDSIGQVASQTIENLKCIYEASFFPILTPLIGMNKREIIEMAKILQTYEISIKPYEDCCSFMVARHPATKSSVEEIKKIEASINMEKIIEDALNRAIRKSYITNNFFI